MKNNDLYDAITIIILQPRKEQGKSCPSNTPMYHEFKNLVKFLFRERCFAEEKYEEYLTDSYTGKRFKDTEVIDQIIKHLEYYQEKYCD